MFPTMASLHLPFCIGRRDLDIDEKMDSFRDSGGGGLGRDRGRLSWDYENDGVRVDVKENR